ncbi:MAG: OmpA family protein [Betaproteobacteria bacterium]|nr:OmpA family protein [Betaproteobacteria bacterium]
MHRSLAPLLAGLLAAASFALTAPEAFAQKSKAKPKDNLRCQPNPIFEKFPGSYLDSCERSRFMELEIEVAKDPANLKGDRTKVKKEGEYWYYHDPIEKDASGSLPSPLELQRNIEQAVRAGGGTVLSTPDYQRSVYYRIEKGGSEYWGRYACGGGNQASCTALNHKIVRVTAMEQTIVVSAEQIARDMGGGGKVVFYGIYFDTDKATIKPESGPTLAEMAKWLTSNAGAKVYIVGHTDMQGAHDHNMKLSRDRATSVAAALAGQHGIAKDRLASDGAGPLAPVASNAAEAGRAKNRRVEMVLR